jgi:adenine-specific DNA-methyltransferase
MKQLFLIEDAKYNTNSAKEIVKQAKELSKLLERKLNLDEDTASRVIFNFILKKTASEIGFKFYFEDNSIEQLTSQIPATMTIDIDPILTNPELLDFLYDNIVAQSYRKKYGQFLTPDYVAEFMASWINQNKPNAVLDPGVGTGVFLDKIVQTAQSLPVELWGLDIDPIMLNACALRLGLRKVESDFVHLKQQDFLQKDFFLKKFDGVICNPPYLNFHDFERNRLVKPIEEKYEIKLSKLTNIYVLFFMQSLQFAKEGARIAFITPSEFLYTRYGEKLKSFLLKYTTLDALILFEFEKLVFNKALTTAVITLFRKEHPDPDHKVKFLKVSKWPSPTKMLDVVIGDVKGFKDCYTRQVFQSDLNPREKWLEFFGSPIRVNILKKLVPLSQIARVDRGIATGDNNYFTLSEPEVKKWRIEDKFLVPVISKTNQCKGYEFGFEDWERLKRNAQKVFLLYCFSEPSPNLKKYIEYGINLGVNQRYLPSHRKPWYSMEKREPAKILATVFHRKRMRFILNSANVRNLTAFHCIYPNFDDEVMTKALLAYLNSNLCKEIQTIKRREYGGGLHKFEPKDLENLPVLDVTCLDRNDVELLASMFDKLCRAIEGLEDEDQVLSKLDDILKSIISKRNKTPF